MIATLVLAMALAMVQADWYSGDFTFECPSGESISAASSDPKWPNEDRKWFFRCQGGGLVKEDCDAPPPPDCRLGWTALMPPAPSLVPKATSPLASSTRAVSTVSSVPRLLQLLYRFFFDTY